MEKTFTSNIQDTSNVEEELWFDHLGENIIANCDNDIRYCITFPLETIEEVEPIPEPTVVNPVFHTQAFDLHWQRALKKAGLKEPLWVWKGLSFVW